MVKADPTAFDGTIGSLFIELTKMKDRYQRLTNGNIQGWPHAKELEADTAQLCVDILWSLKALYKTGNTRSNSVFSIEKASD